MFASKILRVIHLPTESLTLSAWILAVSTALSALLGIFRDRLLARSFGAGIDLDIYAAAFRIPDLIYVFLVSGGLAVAFLPLFSEYFLKDEKEGWEMANQVLNVLLFFLVLFSLILFLLGPQLAGILLPGFSAPDQQKAAGLVRLFLLSPILFGAANIFSGILQYFNRFVVYSLGPIVYNLSIIFGIIFLSGNFGIFGAGFGVVLGAFLYLLLQLWGARKCGFRWEAHFDLKAPVLSRVLKLMGPRTIAVTFQQLKLWLITAVASLIGSGMISVFYLANNLQGFFVNLIGVSFGTAAFPLLSRAASQKDGKEFERHLAPALKKIIFLSVPATIFLLFFSEPLVRLLFRTGQFSEKAVALTGQMLVLFSFSFAAQACLPILTRAFFALQDAKTPTWLSLVSLAVEIPLLFLFLAWGMEGMSLALAFSLASIAQSVLLFVLLQRKISVTF